MRCFKHSQKNGQPMSCPLCRTNWGPNAIDVLRANTKKFNERKKAKLTEAKALVQNAVGQTSGSATSAAAAA